MMVTKISLSHPEKKKTLLKPRDPNGDGDCLPLREAPLADSSCYCLTMQDGHWKKPCFQPFKGRVREPKETEN
jgi:hypothetical protein